MAKVNAARERKRMRCPKRVGGRASKRERKRVAKNGKEKRQNGK